MLSDVDTRHVVAFGILNEQYAPGHRFYGIAHPGMLLVDSDGKIIRRFAEASFRERPDYEEVLDAVQTWLQGRPSARSDAALD